MKLWSKKEERQGPEEGTGGEEKTVGKAEEGLLVLGRKWKRQRERIKKEVIQVYSHSIIFISKIFNLSFLSVF